MRRIYIAIYLFFCFVVFPAGRAFSQDSVTASYSDALEKIDEFLSDGLKESGSESSLISTGTPAVAEPPVASDPSTQSERSAVATASDWKPLPVLPARPAPEKQEVGKTVRPLGEGTLHVVVSTVREKTPRQISIMPQRIELWAQDRLLAILENGDPGVVNAFHRRTFTFSPLTLAAGYYFLTIRGFAEGCVTRERKWKGKTVQIGIHDGKITKVQESLPMFVW